MRGSTGSARIGESVKVSFSGASRCGTPAARIGEPSSLGQPALSASELAGVPMGGAATVCAWTPHIGTAAAALETQPSDSTNAVKVHSRTNQSRRECVVWERMPEAAGSLAGRPRRTTVVLAPAFPVSERAFQSA